MQCSSNWDHHPYRPLDQEKLPVWLERLAPGAGRIAFDFSGSDQAEFFWRGPKGEKGSAVFTGGSGCIIGLMEEDEYEIALTLPGGEPTQWHPVRTGFVPGSVVNYLHPDDSAYAFSGRYLCSPSLVRLPSGILVASMDVYAPHAPQNLTLLFESRDEGVSWQPLTQLFPCFWGKLFARGDSLYMLATSTEYGDLLIGASKDGGHTWSAPTRLISGSGQSAVGGVHKAPMPIVEKDGLLYTAIEWGGWERGGHASAMLTAAADSDLLIASNWQVTPLTHHDSGWSGAAQAPVKGMLEGNAVVGPDGRIMNLLRYAIGGCKPDFGRAVLLVFNGRDQAQTLDAVIDFPGGVSKFCIQKDAATGRYISLVNRVTNPSTPSQRSVLSLASSGDLIHWQVHSDLIDYRSISAQEVGFQYVDFILEDKDLLYLSRTAFNHAHSFHDSNYITFHRLRDFRSLLSETVAD